MKGGNAYEAILGDIMQVGILEEVLDEAKSITKINHYC